MGRRDSYSRSPDRRRYSPDRRRSSSRNRRRSSSRDRGRDRRRDHSPERRRDYSPDRRRERAYSPDQREQHSRRRDSDPDRRREAPDDDRRGRDAEREPPPRARERVDEVDEFGRVRPPPKSPPRRESSASRERRRRERKERKREERKARHGAAAAENHGGADYRESILPPGADLSLYTYDPATYWHVTGDNVWWYRPDLSLWYDCRSETYYTYDASLSEYIGVDRETATSALAEGRNVAPEAPAAAGASEAAEAAEGGEGNATADGGGADGAGPSEQAGESSDAAVFGPIGPAAPSGVGGEDGEEEGEEEGARGPTGEEAVALQLRAHTESWQGKKETQEDRFIQSTRLAKLGTVFGVFDGHGGVHAAEYVAKHLPNNVALCLQKRSVTASASRRDSHGGGPSADSKRLLSALEEAFPLTDRELMSLSRRKAHTDGTTALLVIVHGDDLDSLQLYCAHVGDCRAVLCRGGNALRLTQDHRPDRKDEQQRIRAAGGGVFQVSGIWRCTSAAGAARAKDSRAGFSDGESHTYLSCSRTLGDPELKMNAERPILSNVPDTSATRLLEDDLFFVTACDGVWDVLSDQKVCDIVLEHWGDPAAAASTIVRTALSTGSGDNLTAQVVLFGWKHEAGVAAAARRMREREEEKKKASAPKEKIVVEEDLDMFS